MGKLLQWHLTGGALFLLVGFTSALKGPAELTGFLGSPLSLMCIYNKKYKDYSKYWCKGNSWSSCTIVVETNGKETEMKAGRTSIKDNQTSFEFTVSLDKLTKEDAGSYWCAIERTGSDPSFHVTITVLPAPTTIAVTTTSVSTDQNFPITTTESSVSFGLFDNLAILLPIVFLVLLIILAGALLLMWRLKKKNAAKACKEVPLPMPYRHTEGNTSDTAGKPRLHHRKISSSSVNQAMNNQTAEVEYSSVTIGTPTAASPPQVDDNSESVSYATVRFSTLDEQATYANVQ